MFRQATSASIPATSIAFWHTARMRRCRRCLLPSTVPGCDLDGARVCAQCRDYRPEQETSSQEQRLQWREDLEATIRAVRGTKGHHAVVCLSGGKDSIYLLYR